MFILHVPLTASRGSLLSTDGAHLKVLGKPARLIGNEPLQSPGTMSPAAVQQYLLFDPMEKAEATALFEELKARLPALSLRMRSSIRIGPWKNLEVSNLDTYNGPMPTLIPANLVPKPVWMALSIVRQQTGWQNLLDNCPSVRDERLIAALSLFVSASDEALPRSQFLTYLTILDSLAVQWPRDQAAIEWIDEKLKETVAVNDPALKSALSNLKQVSHGAAVRALVERTAIAAGLVPEVVKELTKSASALYGVRSGLSHAGNSITPDVNAARELVAQVLDQAIMDPSLLDPPDSTAGDAATAR